MAARISNTSIKYLVYQVGTSSYTPVRYLLSRTGDSFPHVMEPSLDAFSFSAPPKSIAMLNSSLTFSKSSHDPKVQRSGGGQELEQKIHEKASSGIKNMSRNWCVFHQDID